MNNFKYSLHPGLRIILSNFLKFNQGVNNQNYSPAFQANKIEQLLLLYVLSKSDENVVIHKILFQI